MFKKWCEINRITHDDVALSLGVGMVEMHDVDRAASADKTTFDGFHVRLCVCMYVYRYVCACVRVCVYIYSYLCMYMYTYVYTYMYIYVNIYIYKYVYIYTYIYTYTYIFMYMYIHICALESACVRENECTTRMTARNYRQTE